jgi:hypothetical protein
MAPAGNPWGLVTAIQPSARSRRHAASRCAFSGYETGAHRRELGALHERVRSTKSVLSMRSGVRRVGHLNPRWHVVENDA